MQHMVQLWMRVSLLNLWKKYFLASLDQAVNTTRWEQTLKCITCSIPAHAIRQATPHRAQINLMFIFTFMHLADAFIQSDLQLHLGYTFSLVRVFPGNRTHNLLSFIIFIKFLYF